MKQIKQSWRESLALLQPHQLKLLVIDSYSLMRRSLSPLLHVFVWSLLIGLVVAVIGYIGFLVQPFHSSNFRNLQSSSSFTTFAMTFNKYVGPLLNAIFMWAYLIALRPTLQKKSDRYIFSTVWHYRLAVILFLILQLAFIILLNQMGYTSWLNEPLFALGLLLMLSTLDHESTTQGFFKGMKDFVQVVWRNAPLWLIWLVSLCVIRIIASTISRAAAFENLPLAITLIIMGLALGFMRIFIYIMGIELYLKRSIKS